MSNLISEIREVIAKAICPHVNIVNFWGDLGKCDVCGQRFKKTKDAT